MYPALDPARIPGVAQVHLRFMSQIHIANKLLYVQIALHFANL